MALEFHKLTRQLNQMVEYLAEQGLDQANKVEVAIQILLAHADEAFLPYIHDRVQDAIDKDAGYRGARPLDEPIMNTYPPSELPPSATLVSTDGSQIYPRRHDAVHYYLLNIGTIILHHGSGLAPEILSQPYLFFENEYVYPDGERGLIGAVTINARRTVAEMAALAEHTFAQVDEARPLVALLDGPLLFVMGNEVPERDQLRKLYFSAMNNLHDSRAILAGYTSRPNSTFITRLLHLLDIPAEEVRRSTLANSGRMEGIKDAQIYQMMYDTGEWVLPPGHRTALFTQMSPQNKEFRQRGGENLEIVFFYMNVALPGERPHIARVEVPSWVIEDRNTLSELQSLLHHQCQQITARYPYVLMRADELAYVRADEQQQLNTMIKVNMTRFGMETEESSKQVSKNIARGKRTHFEM